MANAWFGIVSHYILKVFILNIESAKFSVPLIATTECCVDADAALHHSAHSRASCLLIVSGVKFLVKLSTIYNNRYYS